MDASITPQELQAQLAAGERPVILDLRRQADYDADPELIPGARKLDAARLPEWAGELPPGAPVIVVCAHGGSISAAARQALEERGIPARIVAGGHSAWKQLSGGK